MLFLILQTKCHSGDSWTQDPRKLGLKGAPEGTLPVPHSCPLPPVSIRRRYQTSNIISGQQDSISPPAAGTNAQGALSLGLSGLG